MSKWRRRGSSTGVIMKNIAKAGLFALAFFVLVPLGEARAQAISADPENDDSWRFSFTPYLFLPVSTTGTSTVAGVSADLDLSLSDVFDVLNFAISARGEAWKGDFGVMMDFYYINIGGGSSVQLPGPGAGSANVDVKTKQGWFSLIGTYRFLDDSYRSSRGAQRRYAFDAGVGFKVNSLHQTVDAQGRVNIGPGRDFQTSLGGTETWVEPAIHLRGAAEVSEEWTFATRAEMSGFGVGGDRLQWIVTTGFDYQPWTQTSLKLGWQFYGINYATDRSDGRFAYDVFQTGPFLGASFAF